ncbi:Transposon Tf2-9 poly [Paramuricea clavata]|uniref:Transposon Tf2-9 poly n=1 Tax=Paramuricea clavata TaxID=317549 RepID=A0A7D9IH01_PARCT|nr:Transposon Tf2-9 poly [Paramuricea clavata]
MDKQVEERIRCCHPCQLVSKSPRPEPMEPTKLPKKPWSKLAIDVCGPFPTGEQVVVLTDYYSRWPEVKILKSVTSKHIPDWLLSVFATHGFPDEIKCDNASYFVSTEFKDTLTSWGIEHKTNDREVKTKLPSFEQQTNDETETRKKDEEEKEKSKKYTDKKRKASPKNLEVGNKVLVTQKHRKKFTTKFHPDPMVITKINGTQIVLKDKNGTQHRRNSSHVKLYQEIPDPEEEIQSDRKHDRQTESREENTEATQTETNQSTTEAEIVLRRSTRNRKQPDYLKVG